MHQSLGNNVANKPATRRNRQLQFHFLLAGGLALAGTVFLWWFLSGINDVPHWLASWLIVINILTFAYFGYDKSQARGNKSRIPELVLHGLAAVGGSVGAFAGMELFRHKTVKGKFRILYWCIVTLQALLVLWVIKMLWWPGE